MISFITDSNNDLMLDQFGDIRIETGLEAYRQNLINNLRLQQYEYPYNLSNGLNYLGYILGDSVNFAMWESQLFDLIKSSTFVKSIVDWSYNVEKNVFLFNLVVNTDLGEIEIKG